MKKCEKCGFYLALYSLWNGGRRLGVDGGNLGSYRVGCAFRICDDCNNKLEKIIKDWDKKPSKVKK